VTLASGRRFLRDLIPIILFFLLLGTCHRCPLARSVSSFCHPPWEKKEKQDKKAFLAWSPIISAFLWMFDSGGLYPLPVLGNPDV